MARYLVTGGAGFIGTNIVKQLLAEGHDVVSFDNYTGGRHADRVQYGATYVEGDIRNMDDLNKVMAGIDGVFHTAAVPRMPYSIEHPQETNDHNVTGTLNVLVAARDAKVKRLVYSASSSAYGKQTIYPFVETMKPRPLSPYGLQKYIGEEYCRLFSELYSFETVSLRYFNVYGPYMDPNGAYALVIGKFLKQKMDKTPLTICGDGEYYRDYTHVQDIVRANILAMTKETVGKGEVINIGNRNPKSVNELAKLIGGETVFVPPRPGDPRKTEADITLAKELLGWEPTITLEDGVLELKKLWGLE
ncbi:MAG TPA: NAD-dependent epimerase/dehydratase family protein [Candidatus Kapabacteria bacterium]|nr:NAD-dependent epimerase/dehydratase family protein [Candidatus Kapabacteria bacterium]